MKVKRVEKGDLVGFHQRAASQDELHVRGSKKELQDMAKAEGKTLDIHQVTGTHAPVDEWYGIIS